MTHLIQIGNSRGVRIPLAIIQQAGLENVELQYKVVPNGQLIAPVRQVRQGWAEACLEMRNRGDDELIIPDSLSNQFDEDEWGW